MTNTVSVNTDDVSFQDAALFGGADPSRVRLFARRAFSIPEVRSLSIEPAAGSARLGFITEPEERGAFLRRLAERLRSDAETLADAALPAWPGSEPVRWLRCGNRITTLDARATKPGALDFRHPFLNRRDKVLMQRLGKSLKGIAGVRGVAEGAESGSLSVFFSPSRTQASRIIRVVESELARHARIEGLADPAAVPMTVSNTAVGIGTVGELLLPVVTPVAAGLLVVTHFGTARNAAVQLGQGKVGVPLFLTALLTCSIVTGQVLAFALTDWSLRYWQRRWRKQLIDETRQLVDATLPARAQSRVIGEQGASLQIAHQDLPRGATIRVLPGEMILADGRVVAGTALTDDTLPRGSRAPQRKSVGDAVLAGSVVLAGELDFVVESTGLHTQAGRMAETLAEVASVIPLDRSLEHKAENMADRTAVPTLATAGVGWLAGDLITVGAILHQDWMSGPALAVPLLTINHIRAALRSGALIQNTTALTRLAESHFIVLDGDDPELGAPGLELATLRTPLPDPDTLLRHVAGASLFLGGERCLALAQACQDRGLVVRQPELLAMEPHGALVKIGKHQLRLTEADASTLRVEIDGAEVAELEFRPTLAPAAVATVTRLKALGLEVFLLSSTPDEATQSLAQALGIKLAGGGLDPAGKIRFLQGLRKRGVRAAFVGRLSAQPELQEQVHVSVSVDDFDGPDEYGDIRLLGEHYGNLPELIELARGYEPAITRSTRMASIPNLLCIAGAFGGVLNGITSGLIANVGVANVDRQLRRKLAVAAEPGRNRTMTLLR